MAEETTVTQPSNQEPPPQVVDVSACVALYVQLRDEKADLKKALETKLKPYNEGMAKLETMLLKALQDQNADRVGTPSGTVYKITKRSATIKDKKAFRDYVVANEAFDLADWKANKKEVFSHMDRTKEVVPGVNTTAYMTVGVLRGNEQENDSDE